jgi:cation/acetate symporter
MMGIFSKKMNSAGRDRGDAGGPALDGALHLHLPGLVLHPGHQHAANTPENWLFGISPLSFGAVGAILNFAAAYITLAMTKPAPPEIQELVESIRVPRGASTAQSH